MDVDTKPLVDILMSRYNRLHNEYVIALARIATLEAEKRSTENDKTPEKKTSTKRG